MEPKKIFEFIKTESGEFQFNSESATQNEYLTAILILAQQLITNKPQFSSPINLTGIRKMLEQHLKPTKLSS